MAEAAGPIPTGPVRLCALDVLDVFGPKPGGSGRPASFGSLGHHVSQNLLQRGSKKWCLRVSLDHLEEIKPVGTQILPHWCPKVAAGLGFRTGCHWGGDDTPKQEPGLGSHRF